MTELDDHELLARYAQGRSEAAFESLVARYVNLVYSAALRFTGNPHHAQEITQAVFMVLARKAGRLQPSVVLSGWLYQTARLTAANFVKSEIRRQRREQEAFMQSTLTESEPGSGAWDQIAPLLEEAMGRLGETDRNAIVLRFFQNRTAQEVAAALKLKEGAAHKRVSRALEKLRRFFARRGVRLSAVVIAGALAANSVQAAPAGLAATTAWTAAGGASVAASIAALAEGTLRLMAWVKLKVVLGLGAGVVLVSIPLAVSLWPRGDGSRVTATEPVAAQRIPSPGGPLAEDPVAGPRELLSEGTFLALDTPPGGLAVQPDGKILVAASLGGCYIDPQSGRLGQFERGAFRLNPDGSLDRSFSSRAEFPGSDAQRAHVLVQPDGRVFLSGLFDAVEGQPRPGYASLLANGRVDEAFVPWRGSTNAPARTYLPGGTYPAAVLSDGSVAVMSGAVEGPRAPYPWTVYRLDASGKWLAPAQTTLAGGEFSRPSGLILTLTPGGFSARKEIHWTRATPAARRPPFSAGKPRSDLPAGGPVADLPFERWTEAPSAADAAVVLRGLFEEVPVELCRYAVRLPDGGMLLAIRDRAINGASAPGRFMRFDQDWRPDFTFTNRYEADARSAITLKRQPDGKFLVAGIIGQMSGEAFPGLARLNEDGQIDRSFHCDTGDSWPGRVMDVAVQADGRIIICGFFTSVNGVKRQHLARLNPDGSLDTTFKPPFLSLEALNTIRFPVHQLAAASGVGVHAGVAAEAPEGPVETILITAINFQSDGASIRFQGSANHAYLLQAKDSLAEAEWKTISTSQADANGTGSFRDAEAKGHPTRFYRVASR